MKYLSQVVLFLAMSAAASMGQTPPVQPVAPPVKMTGIKVEAAALPGSSLQWTKIFITFTSTEKWSDGIVFNVSAVLGEQSQFRTVSGLVRYVNVPAGTHNAVLYISPRATARFGTPVFVQATCMVKDQEAGALDWQAPNASVPEDWQALNRYPGVVVDVLSTPWLLIDYEKSPDVVANR